MDPLCYATERELTIDDPYSLWVHVSTVYGVRCTATVLGAVTRTFRVTVLVTLRIYDIFFPIKSIDLK